MRRINQLNVLTVVVLIIGATLVVVTSNEVYAGTERQIGDNNYGQMNCGDTNTMNNGDGSSPSKATGGNAIGGDLNIDAEVARGIDKNLNDGNSGQVNCDDLDETSNGGGNSPSQTNSMDAMNNGDGRTPSEPTGGNFVGGDLNIERHSERNIERGR
jgi:hypothetical protein